MVLPEDMMCGPLVLANVARRFDRRVIQGVTAYMWERGGWSLYVEEDPLQKLPKLQQWDGDDAQLARAIRFVREHACDPISDADMLRLISLSRSTLENRFRASLGRTIHAEIQRVQVEQARQLLVHTDLLIKQIAVRYGFKSVPYLTRVFRRHVGLSPGEYRRHRNGNPNRTRCSD